MELHSSLLYEAATNALAADASGENTWTKMVDHYRSTDTASFRSDIKEMEKLIKDEYKLASMPNVWRLSDENGNIRGKTSVQNDIKAIKIKKPVLTDNQEIAMSIFRPLEKSYWSSNDETKKIIRRHIQLMLPGSTIPDVD
jgi:hypothetical protein